MFMEDEILDHLQANGQIHPIIANELMAPSVVNVISRAAPTAAMFPVINTGKVICNSDELAMVTAAYAQLNSVISSSAFKEAVLGASFTETNDLTNQAIYDLAVTKSPIVVDFTMFSGTFMQNNVWHTMGYEDPRYPTVCFANRHFIRSSGGCASLILHETMHILGFSHHGNKTTSVPYTMNRIYEKIATSLV